MAKQIKLPPVERPKEDPHVGTGRTSPIPPQGDWRLVWQSFGEPNPGEWVEVNHPAVVDAMGTAGRVCAEQGCQLRRWRRYDQAEAATQPVVAPPSTPTEGPTLDWKEYANGERHHKDCAKVSVSTGFIFPDTKCTCNQSLREYTAWLLETTEQPTRYYVGPADWCDNPSHASKFANRETAEAVRGTLTNPDQFRTCEHLWTLALRDQPALTARLAAKETR